MSAALFCLERKRRAHHGRVNPLTPCLSKGERDALQPGLAAAQGHQEDLDLVALLQGHVQALRPPELVALAVEGDVEVGGVYLPVLGVNEAQASPLGQEGQ